MGVQAARQNLAANDQTAMQSLGFVGSRLGYMLRRADLLHMRIIREMLAEIGLTPARATALAFVRANVGCGQAGLGRALEINRASATELVNALVIVGALERREGRDRRSHSLHLTATGEALYAQFLEISIKVDAVITSRLGPEQSAELGQLLAAVQQGLENHLEGTGSLS